MKAKRERYPHISAPELACEHCGQVKRLGEHWLVCVGQEGSKSLFQTGIKRIDQYAHWPEVRDLVWCSVACAQADGWPWMPVEMTARREVRA